MKFCLEQFWRRNLVLQLQEACFLTSEIITILYCGIYLWWRFEICFIFYDLPAFFLQKRFAIDGYQFWRGILDIQEKLLTEIAEFPFLLETGNQHHWLASQHHEQIHYRKIQKQQIRGRP